ncbi:hypothetical protein OQA88_6960 [Cercophora sp. LCS_1]
MPSTTGIPSSNRTTSTTGIRSNIAALPDNDTASNNGIPSRRGTASGNGIFFNDRNPSGTVGTPNGATRVAHLATPPGMFSDSNSKYGEVGGLGGRLHKLYDQLHSPLLPVRAHVPFLPLFPDFDRVNSNAAAYLLTVEQIVGEEPITSEVSERQKTVFTFSVPRVREPWNKLPVSLGATLSAKLMRAAAAHYVITKVLVDEVFVEFPCIESCIKKNLDQILETPGIKDKPIGATIRLDLLNSIWREFQTETNRRLARRCLDKVKSETGIGPMTPLLLDGLELFDI